MFFLTIGLRTLVTLSGGWPTQCVAENSLVGLDHVVVAVTNLDRATISYQDLGFTMKEGRLHANRLRNRHIKFMDGTSLELMSIDGVPGDAMAQGYADFLMGGEGGAYLALGASQNSVISMTEGVGPRPELVTSGGFRIVTFSEPGLESLFFIEYEIPVQDADSVLIHANGAHGIESAWLEASPQFEDLLMRLGAIRCGEVSLAGRTGMSYGVRNGRVIVFPPSMNRPRVLKVGLLGDDSRAMLVPEARVLNGIVLQGTR
jgi:hypothetical protein